MFSSIDSDQSKRWLWHCFWEVPLIRTFFSLPSLPATVVGLSSLRFSMVSLLLHFIVVLIDELSLVTMLSTIAQWPLDNILNISKIATDSTEPDKPHHPSSSCMGGRACLLALAVDCSSIPDFVHDHCRKSASWPTHAMQHAFASWNQQMLRCQINSHVSLHWTGLANPCLQSLLILAMAVEASHLVSTCWTATPHHHSFC